MFRIRFFTPTFMDDEGRWHAGGELMLGTARLCFLADLSYWAVGHYERQWRDGISRLVHGPSSALMTSYRGPGVALAHHTMWALWREEDQVWVQEHTVVAAELDAPFNPNEPYEHVGVRVPAAENGLPIPEWRVGLEHVHAAVLGIRLPKFPR